MSANPKQRRAQPRNDRGEFTITKEMRALMDEVKVTSEAAIVYAPFGTAPVHVRRTHYNRAGGASGKAPLTAKSAVRRFREWFDDPTITFEDMLQMSHDPERDPLRVLLARTEPVALPVTPHLSRIALNRVAVASAAVGFRTMAAYDAARVTLIVSHRRAERKLLERSLPTGMAIAHCCGGWNNAQRDAGLVAPRLTVRRSGSVPIPDAQAQYFARHGVLASELELAAYARTRFSLQSDHGTVWPDWIELSRRRIIELGLPAPPPYGAPPPPRWTQIKLDVTELHPQRPRRVGNHEALAAVEEFLHWLPRRTLASEHMFRAFATLYPWQPTLRQVQKHGALLELLKIVSFAEWRNTTPNRSAPKTRKRSRAVGSGLTPPETDQLTVLAALAADAVLSAREIRFYLGRTATDTLAVIKHLVDAGLVAPTEDYRRSRKQRYVLTRKGKQKAKSLPAPTRHKLEPIAPRPRSQGKAEAVLTLVLSHGDMSVVEIATELGMARRTANLYVSRLLDEGRLVALSDSATDKNQRYRVR